MIQKKVMTTLQKQWKERKEEWKEHKGKFIALRSDGLFFVGDTWTEALNKSIGDGQELSTFCDGIGIHLHMSRPGRVHTVRDEDVDKFRDNNMLYENLSELRKDSEKNKDV